MPILSFKVTPEQEREIRFAARRKKTTVSEYLRKLAVPQTPVPVRRIIKKHPVSGLPCDATFAGKSRKIVTVEEIKASLVDFP